MRVRVVPIIGLGTRAVLADRHGLAVCGVFYLLVTVVLSSLWTSAAGTLDRPIAGYSATALVWYIATSEAVTIAQPPRLVERFGEDVSSGRIETELLRPTSPLLVRLAVEVGTVLPRLAVCGALGVVYAAVVVGAPPRPAALALAAPAVVLAAVVNVMAQLLFATVAFWLREARSAAFLYQKLTFVLGGMLLPLEVLPDGLETVARWLPFAAMAYVPARLASGHVEPWLLATQLAWLGLLGVGARAAAEAGHRRLLGTAA